MKKFLPYILILVMLVGFFTPFVTHAQSIGNCAPGWDWTSGFTLDPGRCASGLILWVLFGVLSFIALFLMLAGTLLDFVVNYTITEMALRLTGLTGINIAWKILKDLMNIAFIFILVYEGIKMIIGLGSRESVKRFIIGVVLASVLINFSLFFTKILIDASNIITIGLYDTIINSNTPPNPNPTGPSILGLSTPIMRAVGLTTFYSTQTFDTMNANAGGVWNLMFLPILGIVLFLVVTFVFGAIAIMLIIRFLTLILLLVLSPVAYMGLALDFMKPYASQWWKAFNSQLIFPPVFMLMMLVVLTLVTSPGFVSINGNWSDVTSIINTPPGQNPQASQGTIELLFKFAAIIGLIIASLTVSKDISKKGSTHIANATGKLNGLAGTAVMGGSARLGRATLGRWGNNTASNGDLQERAAKGDLVARMKLSTANRMATSSFDGRATSSFGSVAKAAGFGKDEFGKVDVKKENYRAELEAKGKAEAEKAKRYKPSDALYAEAKEKDKKVKDAEDKLKSQEFTNAERIKQNESEEGKNVALREKELQEAKNNKKEAEEKANDKITENNNRIKELKKNLNWTESQEEKNKIQEEMKNLEEEIKSKETEISSMNQIVADREKILNDAKKKRDEFKSKERLDLEAIAKLGKDNESNLNRIYQDRVNAYAERVEKGGVISRYASTAAKIIGGGVVGGIVGGIPGAVVGAAYGTSKMSTNSTSDRATIGRAIRGATSQKKKISKKVLKEEFGYDVDDDKDTSDDNKDSNKKDDNSKTDPENESKENVTT